MVVISLSMHFMLDLENRRKDQLYGPSRLDANVDVTHQGDKNRDFRYLT